MVGRTSIWILNGVATSFMMFAILTPIFGLPLSLAGLVWTPLLIVAVCVSYYGFTFCLASLVNWAPQLRNIVHNIASILLTAIAGVVVPLTFWPQWVSHIARMLPVTHGLQSLRLLLAGGSPTEILTGAAIELLIGLVWFLVGVLTLDRTVSVARRSGAVELA
jgi:ABC-2 type transport system permease protein